MHSLYIIWRESDNTGIPIIDEQHKGIISTINSLHYAILQGSGTKVVDPALVILEQYTIIHFKTEEALMKQVGYPALDEHMRYHRALAAKSSDLYHDMKQDRNPDVVLKFMKDWWLNHINVEDRKYVPFFMDQSDDTMAAGGRLLRR